LHIANNRRSYAHARRQLIRLAFNPKQRRSKSLKKIVIVTNEERGEGLTEGDGFLMMKNQRLAVARRPGYQGPTIGNGFADE
jgi:hypothetical protein